MARTYRTYPVTDFAFRAAEQPTSANIGTAAGHAAVFNSVSEEMWGMREIIRPGAFKKTLGEADVRALFNHDRNCVLGRNRIRNGKPPTLRLSEDATGLAFEVDLPDTSYARDLCTVMDRGDVDQCSFAFDEIDGRWENESGMNMRAVYEARLGDVSIVTYPAYTATDVNLRALGGAPAAIAMRMIEAGMQLPDDLEHELRTLVERMQSMLPAAREQSPEPIQVDHFVSIARRRLDLENQR